MGTPFDFLEDIVEDTLDTAVDMIEGATGLATDDDDDAQDDD